MSSSFLRTCFLTSGRTRCSMSIWNVLFPRSQSTIFPPGSSRLFTCRTELATKIYALGMLTATGILLLRGLRNVRNCNTHTFTSITNIHLSTQFIVLCTLKSMILYSATSSNTTLQGSFQIGPFPYFEHPLARVGSLDSTALNIFLICLASYVWLQGHQ